MKREEKLFACFMSRSRIPLLVLGLTVAACSGDDGGEEGGGGASASGGSAGASGTGGAGGTGGSSAGGTGGSSAGGTGGSSAGGTGGSSAGTGGDSGTGGSSGTSGTGGTGGAPAFVSNTPSAQFDMNAEGDAAGLALVSSNLVDEPSGSEYFQRWMGEVVNNGTTTVCHAQVTIDFKQGASTVASHYGFADAAPYESSSIVVPCIAPGASGFVYSNGFATSAVSLSSVTTVEVNIEGMAYPGATPALLAPTVDDSQVVEPYGAGTGYWAIAGAARGQGGTIYNIGLDAYPISSSGLVIDQLIDTHLESLAPGQTWDFETTSVEESFASYELFFEYLEGSGSYSLGSATAEGKIQNMRAGWRAEVRDRRLLHEARVESSAK